MWARGSVPCKALVPCSLLLAAAVACAEAKRPSGSRKVTLWMADPVPPVTVDSMIAALRPHRDSFTGLAYQAFAVCGAGSNDPGGDGGQGHCSAADATGMPHLARGHPTGVVPDLGAQLTAGLGSGPGGRALELWPVISYAGGRCTERPGCVGNVSVLNRLLDSLPATEAFIADAISIAHKQKLTGFNFDLEVDFMSANLTRFMGSFVGAMHAASPRIGVTYSGGHVADGPLCPTTTASCRINRTIPMDRWISMATYTDQMPRFTTVLRHGVNASGSAYGVGLCPICFAANASEVRERFGAITQADTVREIYLWAASYAPPAPPLANPSGLATAASGMCWPPAALCARERWAPYWPRLTEFLTHGKPRTKTDDDHRPLQNCTAWGCTCQGFSDYFGTYAGRGFGCGKPQAQWWNAHRCHTDAHCACCKGPGCALPGAAPCICPDGPHPRPRPVPGPAPAIICSTPLRPEYICTTCARPAFSWATLPVFVHLSMENRLAFTEAELKVLTKFPIVTIEKWQGCLAPDYTYEETAMLAAAKSIKDAARSQGKHVSVVVWFDSYRVYSNKTLNPDARDSGGIACMNSRAAHFLESSTEHLLRTTNGSLALESFASLHVVDYQRRAMQVFKRDMCLNMTKSGVVDGCGIDGSQQRAGTPAVSSDLTPAVAARWNEGKVCMMNGTTNAIGHGLVLGKMEWELGGDRGYANGIIQEGCVNSNRTVTSLRAVAQRSKALGVPLVFECHANCAITATNDCASSVAAFLVGAGPGALWGFGSWVLPGTAPVELSQRWVAQFEKPLGAPVSDATYDAATGEWQRSFGSGTRVTFNAFTNNGTVEWAS